MSPLRPGQKPLSRAMLVHLLGRFSSGAHRDAALDSIAAYALEGVSAWAPPTWIPFEIRKARSQIGMELFDSNDHVRWKEAHQEAFASLGPVRKLLSQPERLDWLIGMCIGARSDKAATEKQSAAAHLLRLLIDEMEHPGKWSSLELVEGYAQMLDADAGVNAIAEGRRRGGIASGKARQRLPMDIESDARAWQASEAAAGRDRTRAQVNDHLARKYGVDRPAVVKARKKQAKQIEPT